MTHISAVSNNINNYIINETDNDSFNDSFVLVKDKGDKKVLCRYITPQLRNEFKTITTEFIEANIRDKYNKEMRLPFTEKVYNRIVNDPGLEHISVQTLAKTREFFFQCLLRICSPDQFSKEIVLVFLRERLSSLNHEYPTLFPQDVIDDLYTEFFTSKEEPYSYVLNGSYFKEEGGYENGNPTQSKHHQQRLSLKRPFFGNGPLPGFGVDGLRPNNAVTKIVEDYYKCEPENRFKLEHY
jgi:hypothetical protein